MLGGDVDMRYGLREIRRVAQRSPDTSYDRWFTRNVSIWFTAILAPFGVSPNAVTLLNLPVGLAGCGLIALGDSPGWVVAGVVLIHLYAVLDSVDGELARLLDRRSFKGLFLEDWSAYGMVSVFPIAVALYLLSTSGVVWGIVLAVLYASLGRNAMPALRRAIAQTSAASSPELSLPIRFPEKSRVGGWKGRIEGSLLHPTNIRLVLSSLILVEVVAGVFVNIVLFAFLAYIGALLMREAGIVFLVLRGDLAQQEWARLRGVPTETESAVSLGEARG